MSESKMRPCPNCKSGENLEVYKYDNGWRHVECNKCHYLGPGEGSIQGAIRAHNARVFREFLVTSVNNPADPSDSDDTDLVSFLRPEAEVRPQELKMDAVEHVARIIARKLGHNDHNGMHWEQYVIAARGVVEEYKPQVNADGINLILSEAKVLNAPYLAVKIAEAVESGTYQ
jgi:Zn ribbon nucleic-acid-binding protein